ncbi:MAG: metallophosphoesterase [Lachnospiraceae bacterium]|nr:metallophosphoesterase [Lachnospiraceae bacterium]
MKIYYLLTIIPALLMVYTAYEIFEFRFRKYVHYKLDLGLGIRACLITDLHNKSFTKRDLRLLAAEKPDCFFMAGDLLISKEKDYKRGLEAVRQLCALAPVYFSLGNHELKYRKYYSDQWEAFIKALPGNCYVLDNSHRKLGEGAEIFGISLRLEHYKKGKLYDMSKEDTDVFKDIPAGKKKILLAHDPDFYEYYDRVLDADLIVSGHLHGGFVRLPFIGGLVFSRYGVKHRVKGIYAGKHLVSSGAGEHLMPLRVFNRCEIDIIDL